MPIWFPACRLRNPSPGWLHRIGRSSRVTISFRFKVLNDYTQPGGCCTSAIGTAFSGVENDGENAGWRGTGFARSAQARTVERSTCGADIAKRGILGRTPRTRSEEHTSELQSLRHL